MEFATIRNGDTVRGALVAGDRVVLLDASDAVEAYCRRGHLRQIGELPAAEAHYAQVSPAPAHILCIGLNYRSHIQELGLDAPTFPTLFAKYLSTLTGPLDDIVLPAISDEVDGEVELAVVIGRTVHRENMDGARTAIAGFTVANDMSMRDWQGRTTEALQGKVFDRSTPLGPILVTPDEVDDARNLKLSFVVDGTVWRTGTTADLLFSPAELVSYCSMFLTLEPGDIILTGTPGKTPQAGTRLEPGSTLVTSIEGIGSAINHTVADPYPDVLSAATNETAAP
jgi:acylpyruvate hydrolase